MPPFLIPLLPALITALGGAGQAIASQSALNRMNRYNDPRAQLQRLNAAGLPFAAFAAGQSGSQSVMPDVSGIGDAGSALGNFFEGYRQSEGLRLLKAQIAKAFSEANITENASLISNEEKAGLMEEVDVNGSKMSIAKANKVQDYAMKKNLSKMQQHQERILEIDKLIKDELFKNGKLSDEANGKIDYLLSQFQTFENDKAAKNTIIEKMKENGLGFGEALLLVIMQSLTGGARVGGMNIGF